MNEDDDLSLFLESTSQTDSLFPLQTPYGDLNGVTPPPEDFEHLLRECQSLGLPKPYSHSTVPPTPPKTEAVSSPARSSQSDGSSPAKLNRYSPETSPSSPESDVVMESDMNFGHLVRAVLPLDGRRSVQLMTYLDFKLPFAGPSQYLLYILSIKWGCAISGRRRSRN